MVDHEAQMGLYAIDGMMLKLTEEERLRVNAAVSQAHDAMRSLEGQAPSLRHLALAKFTLEIASTIQ
jgi:hypothetical protein